MKANEAEAVDTLIMLLDALLAKLPEAAARSYVDGLSDEQLADVMEALSASARRTTGEPNLLFESAAARLRGTDVARHGSAHDNPGEQDAST